MLTVIGPLAAPDGIMCHHDRDGKTKVSRLPSVSYLREERKVPLMIGHNETVGRVVDLHRSDKLGSMCVATIDSQPRLGSPAPIRNTYNIAPLCPVPTHSDVKSSVAQVAWRVECERCAQSIDQERLVGGPTSRVSRRIKIKSAPAQHHSRTQPGTVQVWIW